MPQDLYHDIFGSILDRDSLAPYLLRGCSDYGKSLAGATLMMSNRGFNTQGIILPVEERYRAESYIKRALDYYLKWLLPFMSGQMTLLGSLRSPHSDMYECALSSIRNIGNILDEREFRTLIESDPRHLFLLASSFRYRNLFRGFLAQPPPEKWMRMGCSILKMCHLIKSIEEDSQDINDYARLGMFIRSKGKSTSDLFTFDWDDASLFPDDNCARRAYVKLASFFRKIGNSLSYDTNRGCHVFNSGDGINVDIVRIIARLKSPESMFEKLGKSVEGEAYDIRDILAITFLLKDRDDSLMLFHALQKQGVILQENTSSGSITQTLFDSPDEMNVAVGRLMAFLGKSEGSERIPSKNEIKDNSGRFFKALSSNRNDNRFSSDSHRKFQCKINFSLPIQVDTLTDRIILNRGNDNVEYETTHVTTQQHSLPVELRISDIDRWMESENKGDSHHDAYKCRQLIVLMNRLFSPVFSFPEERFGDLRIDQKKLYG